MLINQPAPELSLQANESLATVTEGRTTLLLFFNLGCDGCMMRALPVAREIARQYPEVALVGVHSNFGAFSHTREQVDTGLADLDLPFPVVVDDGHKTYNTYEAEGTPHWIVIDEEGVVRKSIFGSQPNALQRLEYTLIETFGH